jgi:hypothetical protein
LASPWLQVESAYQNQRREKTALVTFIIKEFPYDFPILIYTDSTPT